MDSRSHKRRRKLSTHGSSPAVIMFFAMLRIVVPLVVIAGIAAWLLTYQKSGLGSIRVTTSVPGAEIYVAGTMTGYQSDTTLFDIPAGRNIVTVHKPGYVSDPEMAIAEIGKGRIASVHFVLKDAHDIPRADSIPPLRNVRQEILSTGETVHSVPPSAYGSLGPRLVDYSRRRSTNGPASDDSFSQSVLGLNRVDTASAVFTSPAGAAETQITVSSIPDGATIIVNGQTSKRVTPYTFRGLEFGLYVFQIAKPGYLSKPDSVIVQLSAGNESELVAFDLSVDHSQPKPTLTISTTPPAAGIRIDGRSAGIGKASLEVAYGSHTVEFGDAPGYSPPEGITVSVTTEDPHPEITGTYEKLIGNSYLAVLPSEDVGVKFDGRKLRIYVDNELLLDSPKENFDATLLGRIVAGKRLVRVQYEDLVDDLHVNLQDGEVSEVTFRIESFFSKRHLRLREHDSLPLDKWEQKSRRLTVLSSG